MSGDQSGRVCSSTTARMTPCRREAVATVEGRPFCDPHATESAAIMGVSRFALDGECPRCCGEIIRPSDGPCDGRLVGGKVCGYVSAPARV